MRIPSIPAVLVAGLLCASGCARTEPTVSPASGTPSARAHADAGRTGSSLPADASGALRGTVVERLDVPTYTYLRIRTPRGDAWAAIPTNPVAVGTEVTVLNGMPMTKFESKTLKRTFDVIVFGTGVQGAGAPSAAPTEAGASNPHVGNGATAVDEDATLDEVKVARATGPNAHTVAEVVEQRAALKNKTVTIRAKVVKVTAGVMGRNWLHIRDGSGTAAARSNDLVITTTDEAQIGDEVMVTGVVHPDRDLGSGYVYVVLVEDAKLTR